MVKGMKPLEDAEKEELLRSMRYPSFWDRCHKYNWAITLLGTLLLQIVFYSFAVGSFKQRVDDMEKNFGQHIDRIERQIDAILEKH